MLNKKDIIAILNKEKLFDNISDDGPMVVMISDRKKKIPIILKKKQNLIKITTGKFLKRSFTLDISKYKQY